MLFDAAMSWRLQPTSASMASLSSVGCEIICTLLEQHAATFWDVPFYSEARQACGE